ncbi:hypothetical protein DL769_011641 [Monosporascus sp. CRB-8-3]|nr:hypothetical protein DL769_011641 [Monosporascus sp. CRB-8-3]
MATKHGTTTMLPKRKLTTYAKASRKKQSKTTYQPAPADDDIAPEITVKTTTTTMRRQRPVATSPNPPSPSPESESLDRMVKGKVDQADTQKPLKSDRKRKFAEVSSKTHTQKPTRSQEDSSLSAPAPSDNTSSSRPASVQRPRAIRSASSEDADIDMVEARLSSPPPTPTRPQGPKAVTRVTQKSEMPFSPNTMQIWDTLLDSGEEEAKLSERPHQKIPVRLAARSNLKPTSQHTPSRVSGASHQRGPKAVENEPAPTLQAKRRRRRLIDALVEQAGDDAGEPDTELSDSAVESSQPLSSQATDTSSLASGSMHAAFGAQPRPTLSKSKSFSRTASSVKRTYAQGTRVLEEKEEDILLEAFDIPGSATTPLKGKRLELRSPWEWSKAGDPFDEDGACVDGSSTKKIRDIHELRQAGANTRVADAMQDLAEQIGAPAAKPSSSRRTALLRIAEESRNKELMRQFRDHGIDATVLKDVSRETDVISGYLILSILATILSEWSSPHIIQLLQEKDIGKLFARLIGFPDGMKKITQDRRNNLSKRSQTAVLNIHDNLRQLPIWGSAAPAVVSPRTLSLRCLHLLVTQEPHLSRVNTVFPESVREGLLEILAAATGDPDCFNYPANGYVDLCSILSILDFHAVDASSSPLGNDGWSSRLLPIVADVFGTLLKRPAPEDKTLETAILKLTINLTNNNLHAPDIYISKDLVPALAGSICNNFGQALTSVSQDHWADGILDGLVLRLGILINFSEHSVRMRQVTYECRYEGLQPIDEFIRLFLENYRRTAEADSVEKSHLNVVFGYLAVLLGHLCLYAPVRQRFRASHSAKSMGPLLESIREFVHHHKTMESQIYEGGDGHGQTGWAEIEALARQLEDEAAYD